MTDRADEHVERGLASLAGVPTPGPIGAELAAALAELRPVAPRVPHRQLATLVAAGLGYAAVAAWLLGLGPLGDARSIVIALGSAAGFVVLSAAIVVPPAGQVMPRTCRAATLAVAVTALLIAAGLGLGDDVAPGLGASLLRSGCLPIGLATAVVPALLAAGLVRGGLPVGRVAAAAALGAAGGAIGGLVLELHCPHTSRWHLGLIHGGVVLIAAALAAALAARPRRPR